MALKQALAVKTVLGNAELELKADPGEAFRVWDVFTYDPVLDYITLKIDKTTVGYFRVREADLGGHQVGQRGRNAHTHQIRTDGGSFIAATGHYPIVLGDSVTSNFMLATRDVAAPGTMSDAKDATRATAGARLETLLGYLRRKGIWKGWPVAEGQTFRLEGAKNTNARQLIIYEILEPGDIKPEDENGSGAPSYVFINYGNCGASIQAATSNLLDTSANPAEFPDWPFGKVVPAKHEIELLGICGSPFAPKANENANHTYTQFLKLVRDREVLFDEDRQGILFEQRNLDLGGRRNGCAEGISLIGNYSETDRQEPLMFEPPLKFTAGDELNIYIECVVLGTGQAITTRQHEIALIERVTRGGAA